jgi:hypothetical protein
MKEKLVTIYMPQEMHPCTNTSMPLRLQEIMLHSYNIS